MPAANNPPFCPLNRWQIFTLAGAAKIDPRTFYDYLTGIRRSKNHAIRSALEQALREHGHADLIRGEP